MGRKINKKRCLLPVQNTRSRNSSINFRSTGSAARITSSVSDLDRYFYNVLYTVLQGPSPKYPNIMLYSYLQCCGAATFFGRLRIWLRKYEVRLRSKWVGFGSMPKKAAPAPYTKICHFELLKS